MRLLSGLRTENRTVGQPSPLLTILGQTWEATGRSRSFALDHRRRSHPGRSPFDDLDYYGRIGHVDRVAAWGLGDRRSSSARHLTLGRWGDHPVVGRHEVPAWLAPPRRIADRATQGVNAPWD